MSPNQWRPGKRVAIVGGGPGAISTGLAFLKRGYDVRIYERRPDFEPQGGGVLLSTPVLAVLRSYGMDIDSVGMPTITHFKNHTGIERAELPFNKEVERRSGIKGWHYGMLRSNVFGRMLNLVPKEILYSSHDFERFEEFETGVVLHFKNGSQIMADILVGADGIRSRVSTQIFGEPDLFHTGICVYLAWCDAIPGVPSNHGVISHDRRYQASYFPMLHDGKPGFEWWIVEPSWEGKAVPENGEAHVRSILKDWDGPFSKFLDATDFSKAFYRWEVYNRPRMPTWSKGRVVCIGDAVHPVSPYAAYGMGMAIEDGYYLARALEGVDLRDQYAVHAGYQIFESERIEYVTHNMEFARKMGTLFHNLPSPLAWLRDMIFDYTPFLKYFMVTGYLKNSEKETMSLKELLVD